MPTKMRLQRMGKKGKPFYHIVIADGRAPRDGKNIEKIGYYNPLTKPADIQIDTEKALQWLHNGAQPTDTVRSLLKYKGVLLKKHLLEGVKKGAFSEYDAEVRYQAWLNEKSAKIEAESHKSEESQRTDKKKRLENEAKIRDERAKKLAAKYAAAARAREPEVTEEAPAEEPETAPQEVVAAEAPAMETEAAPQEVVAAETPAMETEAAPQDIVTEEPSTTPDNESEKPVE
jgi:small subunit ribosomal protein S16